MKAESKAESGAESGPRVPAAALPSGVPPVSAEKPPVLPQTESPAAGFPPEWLPAAAFVLKRESLLAVSVPAGLPLTAAFLVPDLWSAANAISAEASSEASSGISRGYLAEASVETPAKIPAAPKILPLENFVFFDLETTGLSSGAGTIAFLAAFGRFEPIPPENALSGQLEETPPEGVPHRRKAALEAEKAAYTISAVLRITQYLLLDYPGESAFLEAVLAEFAPDSALTQAPFIVTYNGKSFDAQVLKTRCLMNGIAPPYFRHVDLVHPCRRLWRRVLPSCAQAEIESGVLGLDRLGDIPGAFAPDIWFSFLKRGDIDPLLGICDHNKKDIFGLASIFTALARISEDPLTAADRYRVDRENLALRWRDVLRRIDRMARRGKRQCADSNKGAGIDGEARKIGKQLWDAALAQGCPIVTALSLRSKAIDAERQRQIQSALAFTTEALGLEGLRKGLRSEFLRRKERLEHIDKS
jgi:uncharacterized protein YprB with RNaseH-like and TPR domain